MGNATHWIHARFIAVVFGAITFAMIWAAPPADAQQAMPILDEVLGPASAFVEHNGRLIVAVPVDDNGTTVNRMLSWNGTTWRMLWQSEEEWIGRMVEYRGELIALGMFADPSGKLDYRVVRWDGAAWRGLGKDGFGGKENTALRVLAVYGDELIVGGYFSTVDGKPIENLARWDGATWQPFGKGADNSVRALHVHDGKLYVGGFFRSVDGVRANRLAVWDGKQWSTISCCINLHITSITTYRDDLIIAGMFNCVNGRVTDRIARWDGSEWHSMGKGMGPVTKKDRHGNIFDITVHHGTLFAGGYFRTNADRDVAFLAMWDGYEWQPVGEGVNNAVNRLTSFGGRLVTAGRFRNSGERRVSYLAAWDLAGALPQLVDVRSGVPDVSGISFRKTAVSHIGAVESSSADPDAVPRRLLANSEHLLNGVDADITHDADDVDPSLEDESPLPAPRYVAAPVAGPEPHRHVWLTGLNNEREAVGYASAESPTNGTGRALFWSASSNLVELAEPADEWIDMTATAINDAGHAVGWARDHAGATLAFIWDAENTVTAILELDHAVDVDGHGRVLGVNEAGEPVIWDDGEVIQLPALPGGYRFTPSAMNDNGYVVGSGWSVRGRRQHAFLFADGEYVDLGLAPGDNNSSEAAAISNTGFILGTSHRMTDGDMTSRAVIWHVTDEHVHLELVIDPLPGDSQIIGLDINDAGDAVGISGWPRRPFLWSNGQLYDLRELVDAEREVTFFMATGINADGWITVDGHTRCCGYVLIPTGGCAGDLIGDGAIGAGDLLAMLAAWGECPSDRACPADIDGNGTVDAIDLLMLLGSWGLCPD
jgi:probable HAF family extracellular repeat protein